MVQFVLRRILQAIPTLFGITILTYLLMAAAPGGPVAALTFDPRISVEQRERLAAILGVNDPLPLQYLRWLAGDDWMRWDTDGDGIADGSFLLPLDVNGDGINEPPGERRGVLRGDFGRSFYQRRDALPVIVERIPATLELGIASLVVGLLVGVPIGIVAAVRRGGLFDNGTRILAVVFSAIPVFWLGILLIIFFGSALPALLNQWGLSDSMRPVLPMGGQCGPSISGGCPPVFGRLNYLLLPTFVLATGAIAIYSRYMRASMLDVISQDYIRTAKSKGLSAQQVWFRHGAKNALIPLATFLGPAIAGVLGGAPITERIFSWPGLGRLGVEAVLQQDYPVVMGIVIVVAVTTIIGYILSDILYALIDPRIRFN
jgi:peptide/nickel transport system permease protein